MNDVQKLSKQILCNEFKNFKPAYKYIVKNTA